MCAKELEILVLRHELSILRRRPPFAPHAVRIAWRASAPVFSMMTTCSFTIVCGSSSAAWLGDESVHEAADPFVDLRGRRDEVEAARTRALADEFNLMAAGEALRELCNR